MNAPLALSDAFLERFWSKVDQRGPSDCWPWKAAVNRYGYGCIGLKGKQFTASRVAFAAAGGSLSEGICVRHVCDNPVCCNPAHLEPGTHADNMADMRLRGRSTIGERNPRARLTIDQVREIRQSSESTRQAARRLGVSQTAVQEVRSGRRWGRVQ